MRGPAGPGGPHGQKSGMGRWDGAARILGQGRPVPDEWWTGNAGQGLHHAAPGTWVNLVPDGLEYALSTSPIGKIGEPDPVEAGPLNAGAAPWKPTLDNAPCTERKSPR